MVTTRLYGRHCNQLFQAAHCIAFAKKHGLEYHIPSHTLNDKEYPPALTHLENSTYNPKLHELFIHEKQHDFYEVELPKNHQGKNIVLDGYWQSELYFREYIKDVRRVFDYDYLPKDDTCAIHWRWGDYRRFAIKHPIVPNEYIDEAIMRMIDRSITNFKFFSDEILECKKWLSTWEWGDNISFGFSEETDAKRDFQNILYCSHFIISNSTFGLMTAILSESENKICISPDKRQWFGDGNIHLNTDTIIPESFIQIKY